MRVLLSTHRFPGEVKPTVEPAMTLRALGAELPACAPPDLVERRNGVSVPVMPIGRPVRPLVPGAIPPPAADLPRRAAGLLAAQFGTVAAAADGCDAPVAPGMMPAGVCL